MDFSLILASILAMKPDAPSPEQIQVYRELLPEQKLHQAFDLRRIARMLKASSLALNHPDWSDQQVDEAVRLAFLHARS